MTLARTAVAFAAAIGAAMLCLGLRAANHDRAGPSRALGGPASVDAADRNAFGMRAPGLSAEENRAFSVGNSFFRDNWVVAPASPQGRDGLGPLFNATSCSACHHEDGKGHVGTDGRLDPGQGVVVFVSPRGRDGEPHPVYGGQLQDQAVPGVEPEVRWHLQAEETEGRYNDGTQFKLRRWKLQPIQPAYGPLGDVVLSMRVGQHLVGVGLLEAVGDGTLLAMEDPDDRDGDGISGRAHRVAGSDGAMRVGRLGWKASQPTLEDQVAAALHGDIGITTPLRPHDTLTAPQRATVIAPDGGVPEADSHKVGRLAHYCRVLAVPMARTGASELVERGRSRFEAIGCASCHTPELVTGAHSPIAAFRSATIRPYSDLLLHDMGEDLADHRRDGEASGREWRTAPLWGLGLVQVVDERAMFLHDGRARTIEEAILWHGGEALKSRDAFMALEAPERAAVLAFLNSL
jgi:CxxC motif-containing protein (DUF1111 family)